MNPLLLKIPSELHTERLILRPPRPGDGAMINAAILESIQELKLWIPWANPTPDLNHTESWVQRSAGRYLLREELPMIFLDRHTGQFIGSSGLVRINWTLPSMEIGYWVRTPLTRRGYASEVVHRLTAFAFEELSARRVEIRLDTRNGPSRRVAERCGYEFEGTLRCDDLDPAGEVRDTHVFSKVRR